MLGLGQAIDWAAARAQDAARSFGLGHRSEGADAAHAGPPAAQTTTVLALPSMIWIRYENDAGEISERTVTLREGRRDVDGLHLMAWCHMRREARDFKGARIRELVCLASGERPDSPVEWLEQYALLSGTPDDDDTHRALGAVRDELALLAYLGRADGNFDADEIDLAIDHVTSSTRRSIDRFRCAAYLRRMAPDPEDLPQILERVASDSLRWDRLRRSAHRLLLADGKISTDELGAWEQIQSLHSAAVDTAGRKAEFMGLVGRSALGGIIVMDFAEYGVLAFDPSHRDDGDSD